MNRNFKSAIVRIHHIPSQTIVGAGFLAKTNDDYAIITCAHVVKSAMRIGEDSIKYDAPPTEVVYIDFPFINNGQHLNAQVVTWYPRVAGKVMDLAFLKLNEPLPVDVRPARLLAAHDFDGHEFRAFGFPEGFGGEDRVVKGELQNKLSNGLIQCTAVSNLGYFIEAGFSGTPVYNLQVRAIVGMVTQVDTPISTRVAFLIPVDSIAEANKSIVFEDLRLIDESPSINKSIVKRISQELDVERGRAIDESKGRSSSPLRQRIVGRHLIDVTRHFRNREKQLAILNDFLNNPGNRLISVVGRGGIGKTGLVAKVLSEIEGGVSDFSPDIEVSGITYLSTRTNGITLERVFLDCSEMLGGERKAQLMAVWTNPRMTTRDKIIHLLDALNMGTYIILFDNMEDLLHEHQIIDTDIRLFLDTCLSTPNNVRLLLTSREQIPLPKEFIRFNKELVLNDGLPISESISMLRDLDPNGDYGLRDAKEDLLETAVKRVKGVPRALEIIASILANDPFTSLNDLIQDEFLFRRDEFMDALVRENYSRLTQSERYVIEALAVFGRPIPMVAIDFMLEPFVKNTDTRQALLHLVRAHSVSIDRESKLVSLHPIDRDYIYSLINSR